MIQEHAESLSIFFERCSYTLGTVGTIGCLVDIIDHHTWIVNAVGLFFTFCGSMIFKWLHYRETLRKNNA